MIRREGSRVTAWTAAWLVAGSVLVYLILNWKALTAPLLALFEKAVP